MLSDYQKLSSMEVSESCGLLGFQDLQQYDYFSHPYLILTALYTSLLFLKLNLSFTLSLKSPILKIQGVFLPHSPSDMAIRKFLRIPSIDSVLSTFFSFLSCRSMSVVVSVLHLKSKSGILLVLPSHPLFLLFIIGFYTAGCLFIPMILTTLLFSTAVT